MDTPPEPPTPAPEPEEQVVPQEEEQQLAEPPIPQTPQTALTFLLVSGRRRTMSFDPDTTVGRVKELVWNAWPNGASASSLHRD
jgi:predicted GTPase